MLVRAWFLILASSPFLAWAQGPIETRNHQAASLAFLRLDPRGDLLPTGEQALSLNLSVANSLRFQGVDREDQETQRLTLRYRRGISRGEWSFDVPIQARNGGFMDPFIASFHDLVGIHNFRGSIPYGRVEESLGASGSYGSAIGLGDVVASFSKPVGPQTFWTAALKLPTGNAEELLGSGGVDLGASIYSRWKLGPRWSLFGQAGLVLQGRPAKLRNARTLIDQESLSIAYRVNSRDSWTFQWQSEPSSIDTGNAFFDGPHRQLSLGFTRRVGAQDNLQLYFNEDGDFLNFSVPELVNIAPDFTIGVNWTRRW